jgi:tetratricopeptide (TPR) repeat protein
MPDTPLGQWIDQIHNIVITAGGDVEQNDDMSRAEFINELPDETKKELEDLKKHNASVQEHGKLIKAINDDLQQAAQELKDADNARPAAIKELSKTANPVAIDAKAASIRTAKCSKVESLMQKDLKGLKDSGLAADETPLLEKLGRAQIGLKKYDEAERAYKRILELQTSAGSPQTAVQAVANAGLGEIYARTGKASESVAAYNTAVQLDPAHTLFYLKSEALIFLQEGNAEAQIAAAEKAIAADPKDPLSWYIKANGQFKKAGIDPASKHYDLPEGCAAAYQKYLNLAPGGPYAPEAQSVLRRSEKSTRAEK